MKPVFVTVHGIDGTGKTTASHNLVDALNKHGCDTVHFDTAYDERSFPAFDGSWRSSTEYSILKKIHQSECISELINNGLTVVKDRWVIDVVADTTHRGLEVPNNVNLVRIPDLSILLTCTEKVRQQRIQLRGNPTLDDLIPNVPGTRAAFFEEYLEHHLDSFAGQCLRVDTTNLLPDEVSTVSLLPLELPYAS